MKHRLKPICINIFRYVFIFIICLTGHYTVAKSNDTTNIVVFGTVHSKTNYYDVQIICNIIKKVNPDLILVELDSSFFTSDMAVKPEFENISLENKAVSDYIKEIFVPIRPYDIEGRNKIYEKQNYFKLQKDLSAELNRAVQDSLLDSKSYILLDAVYRFDDIAKSFYSESPGVINSSACDVAIESKNYYDGEGMLQIVSSVPALSGFIEFCKFKRDFWISRNNTMVKKITMWKNQLHPKTILVLCGFEHRYYLRNGLEKLSSQESIKIKDYQSY
jgi:hypothetical protein